MTIKQLKRQNSQDTRTHVVGELYDTERSYVESLQILIEKYMKPLKGLDSNKALIEPNLVDEIFYAIPEILEHHENFLSALQEQLSSDWDSSQVIGNVFIEAFTNQQIIDTYTAFINNWKNARHAIKLAIQAKPAFERFLEAVSREHRNKLTLDALLIMPVQRIPRYELLIKELIKHTPEDHPDHGPLIEAQKEIHELALKIDRAEREMIHQEQLKDLESLIEGHVELQQPQRDFIRYDLVTIAASSSLTVARKERVLFLFCDLLIMTSVKKKVSRRSNLQAAFANSTNDLSLLEGNKFKLILRVSLDQVEVRHQEGQVAAEHQNQILQQQQQQQEEHREQQQQYHEQQLRALEQRRELVRERQRELESDLCVLQQIELLSGQLVHGDRGALAAPLGELMEQARLKLDRLEQQRAECDSTAVGAQQGISPSAAQHSAQLVRDLYLLQAPLSVAQAGQGEALHATSHSSNSSAPEQAEQAAPGTNTTSKLSDVELEFIIHTGGLANSASAAESTSTTTTTNQAELGGQNSAHAPTHSEGHDETLVVTFATHDRRQAFLQAFLGAKQQRSKQQQQQQQMIFSSSMTLRLSQPDSHGLVKARSFASDTRRNRLQHQDELLEPAAAGRRDRRPEERISSAPCAATITHQMSAPLSISKVATEVWPCPLPGQQQQQLQLQLQHGQWEANNKLATTARHQCGPCAQAECAAASLGPQANHKCGRGQHHHHHHHQLMHQPASHPALLHTICCHEQHNSANDKPQDDNQRSSKSLDNNNGDRQQNNNKLELARVPHSGGPDALLGPHPQAGAGDNLSMGSLRLRNDMASTQTPPLLNDHILMLKFVPRFLLALPMTFLNTQHPALQFTGSVSLKFEARGGSRGSRANTICDSDAATAATSPSTPRTAAKCQTVRDDKSQLWLCMSNGYVSHVALIKFEKQRCEPAGSSNGVQEPTGGRPFYNIVPVVQSGGDICKSQINCAAQVSWSRPVAREANRAATSPEPDGDDSGADEGAAAAAAGRGPPEVLVKSASPPTDIKQRQGRQQRTANLEGSPRSEQARADRSVSRSAPSSGVALNCKVDARRRRLSSSVSQLPASGPGDGDENDQDGPAVDRTRQLSNDRLAGARQAQARRPPYQKHQQHHHSHDQLRCRNHVRNLSPLCMHNVSTTCGAGGATAAGARGHRAAGTSGATHQHRPANQAQPAHQHHHHGHHHHHHSHNHHHHHHHNPHQGHPHLHHHHHQHHHHSHQNQHQSYHSKHHTVPLAELRRALERQNRIVADKDRLSLAEASFRRRHLAPPSNTPCGPEGSSQESVGSSDGAQNASTSGSIELVKKARSTTPPGRYQGGGGGAGKSFRSARLLRHQASLKTSSILAKLVSSAGKGSSYLRRSSNQLGSGSRTAKAAASQENEENAAEETDAAENQQHSASLRDKPQQQQQQDSSQLSIVDINPAISGRPASHLSTSGSTTTNHSLVSPLSSASSLNSTNSSMTINSVCASSPNRGSCAMLLHDAQPQWSSTTCCTGPSSAVHLSSFAARGPQESSSREDLDCANESGALRSRSATVPCRSYCEQTIPVNFAHVQDVCGPNPGTCLTIEDRPGGEQLSQRVAGPSPGEEYKVSDIVSDTQRLSREPSRDRGEGADAEQARGDCTQDDGDGGHSSLWLGCDDGSLIIIDCLAPAAGHNDPSCNYCEAAPRAHESSTASTTASMTASRCQNIHSELKLRAPISDIKNYKDEIVFVSLTDGRLVVFRREPAEPSGAPASGEWLLTRPQILTITQSELNLTSQLCLVDDDHLWYSYGRSIFVLSISELKIETTIMTPTNDKSIQFAMQTVTIDTMELVPQLGGVWLSFRGNPLLQFYDTRDYKLLLEMSLLDSINKVLSCGNEIIRQHKMACLGATSLLSIYNEIEDTNSLFVGTSAGIIIYLTISMEQLREHIGTEKSIWNPQVISLRHGHSGQVRFLRLVELGATTPNETCNHHPEGSPARRNQADASSAKRDLCLVSGGAGVDLYGPNNEQEVIQQLTGDDDCLNHLILWEI